MSDPPSGPAATSLRPALVVVAGAAGGFCVLELVLLRSAFPDIAWLLGLLSLTGVLYVLAGVLAWDRRPSNRLGCWLVVIGYAIMVARLSLVPDPLLASVGLVMAQTPIAGVVVLMLLFPSGRFRGRLDRTLAVLAFVIVIGFAVPSGLFRPADASAAWRLGDAPGLLVALAAAQIVAWWALLGFVVVLLVRRLGRQRAVRGERRARIAVYVTGLCSVLLLPLVGQLGALLRWDELLVFVIQVVLIALVPVVFTTSLLAGGFGRTGRLEELAAWLGRGAPDADAVRDALAATLGDATVQLAFTRGAPGTSEVVAPTGAVSVELGDGTRAVITYDTAAVPDEELVAAAGRVVAVGLDRDRLTTELVAERAELRRSRARIVEAGDAERRRLAGDLHDGLQSRLVLAAIQAGTLAAGLGSEAERTAAARLRIELEDTVADLRRLVHGLVPALLLERGLAPAVRELAARCGLPSEVRLSTELPELPPAVATSAYFVIAEAVTNAVKHAAATQLVVIMEADGDPAALHLEVRDDGVGSAGGRAAPRTRAGAGLSGLADRVEALGGSFAFRSRPGEGSVVVADIPIGRPELVAA